MLQLLSVATFGWNAYVATNEVVTNGAPTTFDDVVFFGGSALIAIFSLATVLATQRWAPRPTLTAPLATALAWAVRVAMEVQQQLGPTEERTVAQWVGSGIFHALMLFFMASLLAHQKTRAWLSGRAPDAPALAPR